jgi:histone H3/H4
VDLSQKVDQVDQLPRAHGSVWPTIFHEHITFEHMQLARESIPTTQTMKARGRSVTSRCSAASPFKGVGQGRSGIQRLPTRPAPATVFNKALSLRRLARRGGTCAALPAAAAAPSYLSILRRVVRRNGKETHDGKLKVFLKMTIRNALTSTEHARRLTVNVIDVVHALKRQGCNLGYTHIH